jgi:hypothetical protein
MTEAVRGVNVPSQATAILIEVPGPTAGVILPGALALRYCHTRRLRAPDAGRGSYGAAYVMDVDEGVNSRKWIGD